MRDDVFAGTTGAARFTGTLDDLSVADLIQILQLAGKDALITVTREAQESRLWCQQGAIIAAESGRLRGEAAVYRILAFERGAIIADLQPISRERSIFAATQRLLLEGARRKDESQLLREKLGDLHRCVQLRDASALTEPRASAVELELLRFFTSPRSLLEALEESELGDFETLTALAAWLDSGQLGDTGARHTPAPRAPEPTQDGQATLVPLVASTPPRALLRPRARELALPAWSWAAMAALLLAPLGYLIGSSTAHGPAQVAPSSVASEPPRSSLRYAVSLQVQPAEAELWLDGQLVGQGRLDALLPRDGQVHELRLNAPGHVPAKLWFVDAPPPRQLQLDPLPEPASSQQPEALPASEPLAPAASEAPRARKRAAARSLPRREAVRPVQRPRAASSVPASSAPASSAPASSAPRVQIIDGDDPIIRVLD